MFDTIYKAGILILVILLASLLNHLHIFSKARDFDTISKLVMYITMPAAIVSKINGMDIQLSLLLISLLGFLCNWVYLIASKYLGRSKEEKAFYALNMNGYNIGNFALPFVSFFFSGFPILAVSLFDAGSAFMVLGGNYSFARSFKYGENNFSLSNLLRAMLKSPAIWVYLIMIILAFTPYSLPVFIVDVASILGNANTFLSMFMVGLMLDLQIDRSKIASISRLLFYRYLIAALIAFVIYFILPFNQEVKQTLTILVFAPVSGVALVYTKAIKEDVEKAATVGSVSIIISIIIMSVLLSLW